MKRPEPHVSGRFLVARSLRRESICENPPQKTSYTGLHGAALNRSWKEFRVVAVVTKADLSPARARLVVLMQGINFGYIEGLIVRAGAPVLNPPPRVVREVKFGGENGPRPEAGKQRETMEEEAKAQHERDEDERADRARRMGWDKLRRERWRGLGLSVVGDYLLATMNFLQVLDLSWDAIFGTGEGRSGMRGPERDEETAEGCC